MTVVRLDASTRRVVAVVVVSGRLVDQRRGVGPPLGPLRLAARLLLLYVLARCLRNTLRLARLLFYLIAVVGGHEGRVVSPKRKARRAVGLESSAGKTPAR